jgi:hypothetical protein
MTVPATAVFGLPGRWAPEGTCGIAITCGRTRKGYKIGTYREHRILIARRGTGLSAAEYRATRLWILILHVEFVCTLMAIKLYLYVPQPGTIGLLPFEFEEG